MGSVWLCLGMVACVCVLWRMIVYVCVCSCVFVYVCVCMFVSVCARMRRVVDVYDC